MNPPPMRARLWAEFLGTFWLVFGGCGSAVLAAKFLATDDKTQTHVQLGIGFVGVALAFGLTVLTMAYAVGHISGGHFNPAVTLGLLLAKRVEAKAAPLYMLVQVIAGILAGGFLYVIASGGKNWSAPSKIGDLATNGYGPDGSPGGYSLLACLLVEIVLTAIFLWVILGATDDRAPVGFGPIAIGLCLTLIHLISIPVTNTSVNPARSLGVAVFVPPALGQVWLFIVAPLVGAAIAGATYSFLFAEHGMPTPVEEEGRVN